MGKNKRHIASLGLVAAFIAVSSLVFAGAASAAELSDGQESILLSPTSKRYEIEAGSSKTDSFKVINNGSTKFSFTVYARPYSVSGEDYKPDFENDAKNADAYKWIQYDKTLYDIEPGSSVDVTYTVRVPKNATPGGHYGVLFAETQPNGDVEGTAIAQKKRVGSILYATVKGNVTTAGKYLGADLPFLQFKAPLKIRQKVQNTGNTDFLVQSKVEVSDVFGTRKFINQKEVPVLPSTTRSIENDWANPAWIGLYKVEQSATFLDNSKSSSGYVLLIPVWVYLLVVLLIGARILYAVARRKSKK